MSNPIWNVRIEKSYVRLDFGFNSAEEAEAFARTATETYRPDKNEFTVSVRAVFAEDVTAEKEDEENA